jgi:probable HAF family extracellular repeat protein
VTGYGHDLEPSIALPNNGLNTVAYAINNNNTIVGTVLQNGKVGVRVWNADSSNTYSSSGVTDLGQFNNKYTAPTDTDDNNRVIGCNAPTVDLSLQNFERGFYTTGTNLIAIPLASGFSRNCGWAIANNKIVGGMRTNGGDTRAFVYAIGGTVTDLNTLLPANSSWVLEQATGINDSGMIVGNGTRFGQNRAFLLTPTKQSIPKPCGDINC